MDGAGPGVEAGGESNGEGGINRTTKCTKANLSNTGCLIKCTKANLSNTGCLISQPPQL